jgi:ribosomal protein S12 methylthiotransferase accessory factor YcaO
MLNLANFRYRNVFEQHGGPIAKIETSDFLVEGRRMFQANAFLRPEQVPARRKPMLFGDADGTGTADSPLVARHKAVSEAIERWAYYACHAGEGRSQYGFDVDPTSTGLAAFPGLFARQARVSAYFEAVERHSVLAWWEGHIGGVARPTPWPGITAWVIWDQPGEVAVILHKACEAGFHVYGRSAAPTFESACRHAVIELARREYVSRAYRLARVGSPSTPPAGMDLLERRSLFFSSAEGYECFQMRAALRPASRPPVRRTVFDGPVEGPWSGYANVWRVLFEPPSRAFLTADPQYFFL